MAIYMQVEGIEGAVTEPNHKDWIAIKSWELPVERPGVNTTPGKVVDRLRSAVDFPDITVRKEADRASGKLMNWAVNGTTKKVVLTFCKDNGVRILEVTLQDVLLTSYRYTMNEDQPLEEELKLDFTKIDMIYKTYDAKGAFMTQTPVSYDLKTARAG